MTSKAHSLFTSTHARGVQMLTSSVGFWNLAEMSAAWKDGKDADAIDDAEPTVAQYNNRPVIADMGRAGIVIGVSAFDDYFTRRFAECVVPLIKSGNMSRSLSQFLADCGLDVTAALELLGMDRPHRRIRKLVDDHLERHVTQRFAVIDTLFGHIGIKKLSEAVEKRLGRKTLNKSVQTLVLRRHAIAHQGDLNRHGRVVPLDYKEFQKRLTDIKLFVDTAESIISDRMN